jgi:iron complex outermembrane receptor protein
VRGQKPEGGVWEVSPEAFRRGRRSFEALSYEVPGWYTSSNGGLGFGIGANSSGQLGLRGFGGRPTTQLLVLEDGVPDLMGLFGHPLADAHPAAFLSSARVVVGGDSVRYGSGAMAGTLLLETPGLMPGAARAARPLESLSLEAELGGARIAQGTVSATGGGEGVHHWGGFVRGAHSGGHRPYAGARQGNALAKLEWALGEGLVLGLRSRADAFAGADPGPVHAPFENHHYEALRLSQSARLRGQWGAHSLGATAFANLGFHRFHDGFSSKDGLYGLLAEHRMSWQALQLLWGLDARLVTGHAHRGGAPVSHGTRSEGSLGLFAQAEWQPTKPLRAVGGGRFQHVAGQDFALGKAELHWAPLSWLHSHARYLQNFRSPTLSERYLAMPVANPHLKVERADTADVGMALHSPAGSFSLAGFLTNARHLIAVTGAPPALQRENVERLRVYGLEGQWEWQSPPWQPRGFRGSLSFSRQWPDSRAMRVPHTQVAAQTELRLPSWTFSLSAATWVGLLSERLQHMPPVTTTGVYAEFAPSTRVRLWARASNLLGQQRAFNFGYPLPGFEVFAGLRLEAKPRSGGQKL